MLRRGKMAKCELCIYTVACVLTLSTLLLYVKCSIAISQDINKNKTNTIFTEHDDAGCHMEGKIYKCMDIPTKVPTSITDVEIIGYGGLNLTDRFSDPTWKQVTRLHLTTLNMAILEDNSFAGLCLLELVLVSPQILMFDVNAFSGLEKLEKLDLIDMQQFVTANTLPVFIPGAVPELKYFTFNPGIVDYSSVVQVYNADLDELLKRPLYSVNISNTNVQCEMYTALLKFILVGVDVLNISGSTIESIIPTSGVTLHDVSWKKPAFKTLDISRTVFPYTSNINLLSTGNTVKHFQHIVLNKYILLVENFYCNYFYKQDTDIVYPFDATNIPSFWKAIHFRGNNIKYIRADWTFDLNNTLNFIDLSENMIKYIHPTFFTTLNNLRTVLLSRSGLYFIQNHAEFGEFLKPIRDLRLIDMSFNKLSYIPYNMFSTNDNLETINLGFNELNTIMFRLDNLQSLVRLDLQSNHIKNIDGAELLRLRSYIDLKLNFTAHSHLKFNLQGNPIECTCKSFSFIKLLSYISSLKNSLNEYDCQYDGEKMKIDNAAVEKSKYLCIRNRVIIRVGLASAFSFVTIFVAIAVYVTKRKKWKESYLEERLYARFKQIELEKSYLVFMAHSSDDEKTVKDHLIEPFQEILSARIKTDAEVIATGDDFKPGHNIMKEIYKFLNISCVLLAVVSNNFCSSIYCTREIEEAINQKKPIILLFIENVDESDMTPFMRDIFKRKVRAKMSFGENGSVEFVPKLEKICDSVISLALKGDE